jgi:hypothetical protein
MGAGRRLPRKSQEVAGKIGEVQPAADDLQGSVCFRPPPGRNFDGRPKAEAPPPPMQQEAILQRWGDSRGKVMGKLLGVRAAQMESRAGVSPCKVFATHDATVQDLMATAHSDAMWLKANGDVLGVHCRPTQRLHEIAEASKLLNIVVSGVMRDRGGNVQNILIEELASLPGGAGEAWMQPWQEAQLHPQMPQAPAHQPQPPSQEAAPAPAAGRRLSRKRNDVAGKIGSVHN